MLTGLKVLFLAGICVFYRAELIEKYRPHGN